MTRLEPTALRGSHTQTGTGRLASSFADPTFSAWTMSTGTGCIQEVDANIEVLAVPCSSALTGSRAYSQPPVAPPRAGGVLRVTGSWCSPRRASVQGLVQVPAWVQSPPSHQHQSLHLIEMANGVNDDAVTPAGLARSSSPGRSTAIARGSRILNQRHDAVNSRPCPPPGKREESSHLTSVRTGAAQDDLKDNVLAS